MSTFFWSVIFALCGLAWSEFLECAPWLAKRIVKAAARRAPPELQERLLEELSGVIDEAPGKLWKLLQACSLWWGFSRDKLIRNLRENSLDATMRGTDILFAASWFVLFFPLYLLLYTAVRLMDGGPAHFYQMRIGKNGKPFRFYKFRSMVINSDEVLEAYLLNNPDERSRWENFQSLKRDPRITLVGRYLRKFSLDELPQFYNVLKGDMSLIGPRPCMERQRELYGEHFKDYCKVRPGITGLWQISGRNGLSFSQRIELDVEYVKHRSILMNLRILVRTIGAVARGE